MITYLWCHPMERLARLKDLVADERDCDCWKPDCITTTTGSDATEIMVTEGDVTDES